ncbi:hypothetical protein TNCT_287661 [Trichonephila clavata]|uniref:Uncharacterized protein n=1 Tax=Trichonephila clavata TaxID=2740835 RepID=A0A8X6J4V9_TRICU|nr:hypothetical protein TNCT_287661 [Trichonephila clavata]
MVEGMRISKVSSWILDLQNHFEPDHSRFLDYHNRFQSSDSRTVDYQSSFGPSNTIVILNYPILGSLITETSRITTSNRRFIPSLSHQSSWILPFR